MVYLTRDKHAFIVCSTLMFIFIVSIYETLVRVFLKSSGSIIGCVKDAVGVNCNDEAIGFIIMLLLLGLCYVLLVHYKIKVDRTFAEGNWRHSLNVIGFVIIIPFIMWLSVKIADISLDEL